jgi:predicted Zn-dependent protease with MMP-like domain
MIKNEQPTPVNIISLESQVRDIIGNFNWEIFDNLIDTKRKRSLRWDKFNRSDIMDSSLGVEIDNNISSRGLYISDESGDNIKLNITKLSLRINKIKLNLINTNLKPPVDLVYIATIRLLMHELMHHFGTFGSNYNRSPISESINELLAIEMTIEYLKSTGRSLSTQEEFALRNVVSSYEPERKILIEIAKIISSISSESIENVMNSFYSSYLRKTNDFVLILEDLPNDIINCVIRWLKLRIPGRNKIEREQYRSERLQILSTLMDFNKKLE